MEFMKGWLIGTWVYSFISVGATFDRSKDVAYESLVCILAMIMKWSFIGWIPYLIWKLM